MPSDPTKTTQTLNKKLPWYQGLWWHIWLTIFAAILIYGLGTALYFRFVITPHLIAQKQAIEIEREQHIQEFRNFIQNETQSYHQELENWRYNTPEGTAVPLFNFRNRVQRHQQQWPNKTRKRENPINTWLWLLLMAGVMGVATYPFARRLTRRLETLQQGVETFGTGHLHTRVNISGNDEVALLAQSFNGSAQQIESLIEQHKQLLAQASHELRTPLARLRMSTELAAQKVPEIALDLRTDIKELDDLVGEILLASRLDAMPDLLQISSFDALGLAAEEAARTRAELDGCSVEVQADETLIRRAIRNLLTNAERYAPHSPIEVMVSMEPATISTPELVCFTVSDHGPGLSPQDRQRIFEPFYRAKATLNVSGGTGLGLSLVKQIAQRHGGFVECQDQPQGSGCLFELKIPTHTKP